MPSVRSKRGLDEDEDIDVVPQKTAETLPTTVESNNMDVTTEGQQQQEDSKKIKPMENTAGISNKSALPSGQTTLNLPIPNSKGQAAIVKIYGADDGSFKFNQIVEFIGFQ